MRFKFNEAMMEYFDVPYSNLTHELNLSGGELLNCPYTDFTEEERLFLKKNDGSTLLFFGVGNGEFELQNMEEDIDG